MGRLESKLQRLGQQRRVSVRRICRSSVRGGSQRPGGSSDLLSGPTITCIGCYRSARLVAFCVCVRLPGRHSLMTKLVEGGLPDEKIPEFPCTRATRLESIGINPCSHTGSAGTGVELPLGSSGGLSDAHQSRAFPFDLSLVRGSVSLLSKPQNPALAQR